VRSDTKKEKGLTISENEMSDFMLIKNALQRQMAQMTSTYQHLFKVDASKDELWDTYLSSFNPEDNPIYRERTVHDCQCCKRFIRACGGMVAITEDNKLVSIWDVTIGGPYQVVVNAMAALVKSKAIRNIYLSPEKHLGVDFNYEMKDGQNVNTWQHFHYELPDSLVDADSGSRLSKSQSDYSVLYRGLDELTIDGLNSVIELIDADSLYRGTEHKGAVVAFRDAYLQAPTVINDLYVWRMSTKLGVVSRFKNSVIGTLVADLSTGVPLEDAVKMFESKVAPENYKRTKALVTPSMIAKAKEKVVELGLMESLPRRYAVKDDITVNNVLFADRSFTAKDGDIFEQLSEKASTQNIGNLKNVEEVAIDDFLKDIMPKSDGIELLVENRLEHNMMSLISPVNDDAEPLFKWSNCFSWAYNGDAADSMKDRVKAAGGRVDGVLRFTHSWNEIEPNQSLMDLHVFMPGNPHTDKAKHESYGNGRRVGWNQRTDPQSGGVQDVDYTDAAPNGYVPIENITFPSTSKMPDGEYICKIHNWRFRSTGGRGSAEIEINGKLFQYEYPTTSHHEWITIATVTLKDGQFSIEHNVPTTTTSKGVWNISTETFCKVSLAMNSPNHWDGKKTGNKHLFFILDGCNSGIEARGFYNEFLRDDLHENRKTFELLGSEMKVSKTRDQLSGLGFSSTQRNYVYCRVTGKSNRVFKITF